MTGFQVYPGTPNWEVIRSHDSEVLIEGPAGTGKTMSVLAKCVLAALKYPDSRILLARKSRVSLNQTVLTLLEQKLLPMMMTREVQLRHGFDTSRNKSYRESYKVLCKDAVGMAELVVAGLEDVARVMSGEFDIIAVFESTDLVEDDWEMLSTRLRNHVLPYQQIIGDCNPSVPSHWLNKRFNSQPQTGQRRRLLSRHHHNPAYYDLAKKEWTPAGVAYISRLQNLSGARKDRLLYGRWVAATGLVYEFDRAIHVIPRFEIPADWPMFWAIDFGIVHPFVAQLWAIDPLGRMIRVREVYMTGRIIEDHVSAMRAICPQSRTRKAVCDHALEERATLERLGFKCYPAIKDITGGIEQCIEGLQPMADGKPAMLFMEDGLHELDGDLLDAGLPTETLDEFDNYRRPVKKDGTIGEKPLAEDDHGMDAMRYARMAVVKRLFGMEAPVVPLKSRRTIKRVTRKTGADI